MTATEDVMTATQIAELQTLEGHNFKLLSPFETMEKTANPLVSMYMNVLQDTDGKLYLANSHFRTLESANSSFAEQGLEIKISRVAGKFVKGTVLQNAKIEGDLGIYEFSVTKQDTTAGMYQ